MGNKLENNFNLRSILILTSLSFGVMSFFLPIYSREMNMSALKIAGLFSIISFILIILRPFIGKLIDKVGRKPVLMASIFIYAIAYLVFSVANTTLLLYVARAIQGVAGALMGVSIYAIVADTHDLNNVSEGFGKVNSARATGNIYGCILAFLILSNIPFLKGWKVLFIVFALACLVALFKVKTTFKESKNTIVNKKINIKNYSRTTIKLLVLVFITALFSSMIAPILIVYLQDKYEADLIWLALAFYPALLIDSILSGKMGSLVDRLGKRKSMIIGSIISAITIVLIPNCTSIIIFAIVWAVDFIGGSLCGLGEDGLYTKLNCENDKGEIFGVYTFISNLGAVIGPLIGGFLYDSVSHKAPFYLNGIAMIIVAILIPILLKGSVNVYSSLGEK